jgi:similar to stage IV sporulation protein
VILDGFRGIIKFTIVTDSPEEFINLLRKSAVSARSMSVSDGLLTGECYGFDRAALKQIADSNHAEFIETERKGFIFKALLYKGRYGIFAGLLASFVMVFFLSNIAMKINITGNETMSDAEVAAVLEETGIYIGAYLPHVNLAAAERTIIANVSGVAWAGIKRSGPIVSVEISEMSGKPDITPTNMPCNVLATKNAQIVKINHVQLGMLKPMLGETVKAGDILVSGVIEGKLHNTYYVHALADITGRYTERITFNQGYTDREQKFSNSFTRRELFIFGLEIPLTPGFANSNSIENAEIEEAKNYFELFSLRLPIGIINTEIRPYKTIETTLTSGEAKDRLNAKIARYEENFLLDEGVTIIDREIVFTENEDSQSVTVEYILESNICQTQYIYVKNHR